MPIDGPNQKLSYAQLEALWVQAGGSKKLAPTMAAIALAESGGNTGNHNPNAATGDDSYGLWQINYYGANRAPRTARWGPPASMYNPLANARAAVDLAGPDGSGLRNWSTYSSGAFLQYMNKQQAGLGAGVGSAFSSAWKDIVPGFSGNNPIPNPGTAVSAVSTGIHDTVSFFQKIPFMLATLGGVLLLILAVALIGADIGIEQLNRRPTKLVRSRLPRGSTARSQSSYDSAREARAEARERREQEAHETRMKTEKARATELRTRTRHRKRTKDEQKKAEDRAYIRGYAERDRA